MNYKFTSGLKLQMNRTDKIVDELYGLNDDAIKIIEGVE
jgi:hypothetical protein